MSTKQNDETQSRWYMVNKDGMATLCADHADAEQVAKDAQEVWPHMGPHRAVQLSESFGAWFTAADMATAAAQGFREGQASQAAVAAGWVSVDERLPEWAARDDTPCFINNKAVPPTLTSKTVLVTLKGGGVRTDKLTTIEGKSDGWWHTYGERVIAWQPTPPAPSTKGESNE